MKRTHQGIFSTWLVILLQLGLFASFFVKAQDTSKQFVTEETLTIMNRDIVTFRTSLANATPEIRVKRAKERLRSISEEDLLSKDIISLPLELGKDKGVQFYLKEIPLFAIVEKDIDPIQDGNFKNFVEKTTQALNELKEARTNQVRLPFIVHQTILVVLATLILGVLIWAEKKAFGWLSKFLLSRGHQLSISTHGTHWAEYYFRFTAKIVSAISWMITAFFVYAWLTYSLNRFPLTQPLGQRLGHHITDTFAWTITSILGTIPNLISIVIIIFVTRTILDLLKIFFKRVQAGNIRFSLLHKETVSASQRIAFFLIWGLTISIIYPLIPGSNTEAFKGLSVLLGIVISLGSTGLVSQLMSGLVVVYSRAIRVGDYVSINGQNGVVTEIGGLSTKIQSLQKKVETTIPNTLLISNSIINYTKLNEDTGSLLFTKVTIGYDAPWRTVHLLLTDAAKTIPEIKLDPEPKVFQRALSDFFVEYELFFHTVDPLKNVLILSDLHQAIQDNFNAAGIQIMSPHYMMQPNHSVLGNPSSQ